MKRLLPQVSKFATAFMVGALIVLAGSAVAFTQKPKPAKATVQVQVDETPVARDTLGRASYAPVVKKVTPAVVKVFTTTKVQPAAFNGAPDMDNLLRRFFGDQGVGPQGRRGPAARQQGIGSGVVVSKDGYILTNNHVVDGAEEVKVSLQDGREFNARVVGRDPKTDVAVIKVEAKDLPAIVMADSDKVEVGDVVLAVGNPFGIGQTVTTGIVSATQRGGGLGLDYEDFIQTDAAINPGNSGGALVDVDGRLIGLNTAILSRSGGNQGIGFAIPANLARHVMESLIQTGHVARGYMGVMIQDLTPDLAREFKLKDNKAVLVGDVTPEGPADKAGFKSGDLVTEFNGKKVSDSRQLKLEVALTQPGTRVPVRILRDGTVKTIEVTVKELPGEEHLALNTGPEGNGDNGTLNGVTVGDLDGRMRQELRLPKAVAGAVITDVSPDSPAAEAGLRPGDVIQEINRKPVKSADEAVRLTENTDNKRTLLRVYRNGGSHYVVVDEGKG